MSSVVVWKNTGELEDWGVWIEYSGTLECWRPEYWDAVNIGTKYWNAGDGTGTEY